MKKKDERKEPKIKRNTNTPRKWRRTQSVSGIFSYRIWRVLTYAAVFCGISVVCLLLSSTVLFSIKEIIIQGDEIYESQVVIEQSGVKVGDNLFLLNAEQLSQKLENNLPEVDEVTVHKKFPGKLVIDIKRAMKAFDVEVDENFVSISNKGKVLSISDVHNENLILLQGLELESYEVGSKVVFADKTNESRISDIIEQMTKHNLSKMTGIDFRLSSSLVVHYDNRIKINFGFYENMDYKIRTAAEIINNKLGAAEVGELDLSEISKENRSYFTPKD